MWEDDQDHSVFGDHTAAAGPKLGPARSTQEKGNIVWEASRRPSLGHGEVWKRATEGCYPYSAYHFFSGRNKPSSVVSRFSRALHTRCLVSG